MSIEKLYDSGGDVIEVEYGLGIRSVSVFHPEYREMVHNEETLTALIKALKRARKALRKETKA